MRIAVRACFFAALLLLPGCGPATQNLGVQDAKPLVAAATGHGFYAAFLGQSRKVGKLPAGSSISLLLSLKNPSAARQTADIAALYSPRSRTFGKFQSPSQYAARYGPGSREVATVRQWLRRHSLRGAWHRGNSWMEISGTAAAVERAFGVYINAYRSPRGIPFYASPRDPLVPSGLRATVASVGRISSFMQPVTNAVPAGGLSPTDLAKAYDLKALQDMGLDGSGETIAFFEVDGFDQKDLDTFTSKYNLPPIQPTIASGPPLKAGGETEMDLEVAHEIAPAAKLVLYNLDWQTAAKNSPTYADYATKYLIPLQDKMVTDNPKGILSLSWGICEPAWGSTAATAWQDIYTKADALGESVYVSTGDSGAYECLNTTKPGTPPSSTYLGIAMPSAAPGVTAVGGTRISVNKDSSWYDETVWEEPAVTGGTGGGVSAYFQRPSWQQGTGVDSTLNPNRMRSTPDVSADADPASGTANYITGSWEQGGGTSQAAPIWAGMTALINQYLKKQSLQGVGFANPALYALANGKPEFPPFHDVTIGANLYYPAGPGYDMASGLGTPDAWNLARDLETYLRNGGKVPAQVQSTHGSGGGSH